MKWVEDYGTLFEKRIEIVLKQYPDSKGLLFYNKVDGILQNGPTCGFVAMSLAARSLSLDSHEVQHLIEYGKEKEYTNNGEMFSSEWVVKICRNFWGTAEIDVIPFPDHNQLVKEMFTGNIAFLMPHDSDKNFEPTKLNGHSAHWAVVIGFMLVVDIEVQENHETRPENEVEWCKSLPTENDSSKLYVIVFHGKSRHPALWSFKALCESNFQLHEYKPDEVRNFRLPQSETETTSLWGLRGKCVRIRKPDKDNTINLSCL